LSIGLGSFLVALALVVAVGIGSAIAVIPNNGTYYACLTKKTGAVKVINYPKVKCAKGTQLIKWSQQGPAGPQGPQGAQGPAGASGSSNWGDIANKPADLADGQIGWGEVKNIPAGFADGVDDGGFVGYESEIIATDTIPPDTERAYVSFDWPRSVFVQFQVLPAFESGCSTATLRYETVALGNGSLAYRVYVTNECPAMLNYDGLAIKIRAIAFGVGLAPAKLRAAIAGVETHRVSKGGKHR
jgi:hypothetical protein